MLNLSHPPLPNGTLGRPVVTRRVIRASRPSLLDLRFKGDPWVVDNQNGSAAVCLGDYRLFCLSISPLDVAGLNRALANLRLGHARRHQFGGQLRRRRVS